MVSKRLRRQKNPNYGQERDASDKEVFAEQIHDLLKGTQFHKKDKAKQHQGHTTKKQTKRRPAKESETAKWTRQIKAEEQRRLNSNKRTVSFYDVPKPSKRKESETAKWTRQIKAEEARRERVFEKARLSRIREEFNREDLEKEIHAEEEAKKWEQEIREEERRRNIPEPVLIHERLRGNAQKWRINGEDYADPKVFLNETRPHVENTINSMDETKR